MQIFVKTPKNKTLILDVDPRNIVKHIKVMIEERESVPVDEQKLVFQGRELKSCFNLLEYDVPEGSTLYLVLRGGMIFF